MSDQPDAQPVDLEGVTADVLLGAPLANYPSDRLRPLILAGVLIGGGGLIVSATVGTLPQAWSPFLAMAIMAGITAGVGWMLLHRWNREIILFEHGFTYREGSNTAEFFYSEIDSIRLRAERRAYFGGRIRRDVFRFTVYSIRGESFTLTNLYRRTAELGGRLQEKVNAVLRPTIARRLEAGEPIRFGDTLRLSQGGLHESGRDLAWGEYGGYRIADRLLVLLDRGGAAWVAVPLMDVDNIAILVELLRDKIPAANE